MPKQANNETTHDHRKKVGEWLSAPNHEWRIPVYQRHYAWDSEKSFGPTQLFWEIVSEQTALRLKGEQVDPHYFGAILVENKTTPPGAPKKYDVVDGQQRLTTVNVALFAMIGIASHEKYYCREEMQGELAKYIFNDPETRRQNKLDPTNFDRTQFSDLQRAAFGSDRTVTPNINRAKDSKILNACEFFTKKIEKFIKDDKQNDPKEIINALIKTILSGFEWVLIELKETDQAQLVFESLNNTATPLTTFDLYPKQRILSCDSTTIRAYGKR